MSAYRPHTWPCVVLLAAFDACAAADGVALDSVMVQAPAADERTVPPNLTTFDARALEAAGVHSPATLAGRVPSLLVSDPNPRYTSYGLRGLGASGFNDGLEGSVGVYLDEVYLGRAGMSLTDFTDLERIEVQRGPEGTAGGRGSTAGSIHLHTFTPTWQPAAQAELGLGERGQREVRAAASGPVNDRVAGSLSAFEVRADGDIDNVRDAGRYNDQDRQGARGQLQVLPDDATSLRLMLDTVQTDQRAAVLPASHYSAQTRQRAAFMKYPLLPADPARRRIDQDQPGTQHSEQHGLTFVASRTLGERATLTSITGYRDWRYAARQDGDNLGLAIATTDLALKHRQFSQEVRFDAQLTDALAYRVGAYYLDQRFDRGLDVGFGPDAAAFFIGDRPEARLLRLTPRQVPASLLNGAWQRGQARQQAQAQAVFGELDWQASERLKVTYGARYSRERKQASIERQVEGLSPLGTDLVSRTGGQLLRGVALGADYQRKEARSDEALTGRVLLDYALDAHNDLYVGWSSGFKAGGFNLDVIGGRVPPRYDSERASSWEAGLRSRFWQSRLELGLALYQTEVRNYQALTTSPPVDLYSPPLRDNLINVPKVRLRGIEVQALARPTDHLDLHLALAWSDARYRDFKNGPCSAGQLASQCDLSGHRLFNAPPWSASAGVEQRVPLGQGLEAFAGVDYSWRSGYQGSLEGGEGSQIDSYGLADLRLGLRQVRAGWEVTGWLRNAFDTEYVTAISAQLGAGDYAALPGQQRTAGVTVRWKH